MREVLNFPLENYVGKSMTAEEFLKFANIHKKENKYLKNHLGTVEILYSFKYDDGEVIVLSAEYFSNNDDQYSLINFVKIIAQSIPYKLLLIANFLGRIRFFCFEGKPNKRNNRRIVISKVHDSRDIQGDNSCNIDELTGKMRKVTLKATSANELIAEWCSILPEYKLYVERKECHYIPEYQEKREIVIAEYYQKNMHDVEGNNEEVEDEDYVEFDKEPTNGLFGWNEFVNVINIDVNKLTAFFAYNCRPLFEELGSYLEISEDNWLELYLHIYNELSQFSYHDESIIVNAFWNGNDDYKYAENYCDLEYLREFISEY